MAAAPALRVAIRSQRRLFRDSLANCLAGEPYLSVVGHAAEAADLIELYRLCHPDILLFDLGPEVCEGLAALRFMREQCPTARLVVMYDRLSPADLAVAWQAGADSLIPASHGLDALVVMLEQYVSAGEAPRGPDTGDVLTDQEREILTLIGAGHTANRIAELMQLTANAVENSKRRIYNKLDVSCQSQAVARAVSLGLADRTPDARPQRVRGGDGVALAVLRGPDVPARREAAEALLQHQIAFVSDSASTSGASGSWQRWHSGPVALVLVDPREHDWPAAVDVRAPMVLVHANPLHRAHATEAIGRGVCAILPADRIAEDLVPALRLAMRGYVTLEVGDAHAILTATRSRPVDADGGLPNLTARECDILHSIACGHTVRQTARSLGIAEKTVENTQARLFRKLGVRNRAGALSTAHALGLLQLVSQQEGSAP